MNLEFTDDPHPRNTYWEMWGLPMFDLQDAKGTGRGQAERAALALMGPKPDPERRAVVEAVGVLSDWATVGGG